MICPRCNKPCTEAANCTKCGGRLQTLASAERRGWIAFGAGVFLIVFMGAIALWVDQLMAGSATAQADPGTPEFMRRLNVTFALIILAGVLGTINGWQMAHTGIRNRWLIYGMLLVFLAGLYIAYTASSGYHPT